MRILLWTTTMMLRAYPAPFREVWARECLQTFQASCADIAERRGPLALLRHVIAEWIDMLRGAIRLRRGTGTKGLQPPILVNHIGGLDRC